jgi:copper transporter 1
MRSSFLALLACAFVALLLPQEVANASSPLESFPWINRRTDATSSDVCASHTDLLPCVLSATCEEKQRTDGWCDPRSLLAAACSDADEKSSPDCNKYETECKEAEQAHNKEAQQKACGAHRLKTLPSTKNLKALIKDMCDEMPGMKACSNSNRESDVVGTYVGLCSSMPGMSECKLLTKLCQEVESKNGKSPSTSAISKKLDCERVLRVDPPEMRMYLHSTNHDYVVFHSWVPNNDSGMFFSCLLIFFLSALTIWLRTRRVAWHDRQVAAQGSGRSSVADENPLDAHLAQHHQQEPLTQSTLAAGGRQSSSSPSSWSLSSGTARAGWAFLISATDMFFMLVAMSFNFWLILAVVLGASFGHFVWGHRLVSATVMSSHEASAAGPCAMCS